LVYFCPMKKSFILLLTIASVGLFYACNSGKKKDQPHTAASDSTRATVDLFLATVHQGCLSSIELAGIANKSNSIEIRNFADNILKEEKMLLDSVVLIAEAKSITLPDSANSFAAKTVSRISPKDGLVFDKALVRAFAAENRRMASAFRSARKIADEDIKAFSKNNKDMLRKQAQALKDLRNEFKEPGDKEEKQRDEQPA
jgi:putative membrane protein